MLLENKINSECPWSTTWLENLRSFADSLEVLAFLLCHHLLFPALHPVCLASRVNDATQRFGWLSSTNGEPQLVWAFWLLLRRTLLGHFLTGLFLLSAESACAEVGSCQVLCYLAASKSSGSASLVLAHVYWENNSESTKEKKCFLLCMQEDSKCWWWLISAHARGLFMGVMVGALPH